MLELLNFFEESTTADTPNNGWIVYLIFGLLLVGMILLMVIPQRKQKKRQEEMMSKLAIGSIVTTIGGIVGEVVQLDDNNIWLLTGLDENKTTMQFVRQAIHSIAPAPGSPEAEQQAKEEQEKENEVDEIK